MNDCSGLIAVPKAGSERPRLNVSEAYYDKQQKASILHDLRTPTRQSGRSAIRQYRWRLLGMHRRYRGGNGMLRVARLRTQRIRGRTSAWLDRSIQALIRKLHYDRFGSTAALRGGQQSVKKQPLNQWSAILLKMLCCNERGRSELENIQCSTEPCLLNRLVFRFSSWI